MTPIFEGQPPKTRPFPIKTRVIWVLGTYIIDIFIFLQVGGPVSKMENNKLIWNLRNGQHVQEESNCKVRQFGPNTLNFTCFKMPLIYKRSLKTKKTDISLI